MNLGEAVLELTIDENGLVTGFAKAKEDTGKFVDESKQQTDGFKEMWEGAMNVLRGAGVLLALEGLKKIIEAGREMLDAFAEDERATVTMNMALSVNKNVTDAAASSLLNWSKEMQKTTEFTDDQIERNVTLLSGMDMTEAQMRRTLTAAMNLASAYHIDLDQAVRGLASSLENGTIGMLARQIPTLRQFTEEQLKHGAAVEWVESKYTNAAEVIGNTTAGLQERMAHVIDEQKEKIGAAIADSYRGIQNAQETIEGIGNIAATVVGILLKSLLTLADWFKWQYDVVVGFFKLVLNLVVDVARLLWAPIEYAFHDTIEAVKNAFVNGLNWMLGAATNILKKIGVNIDLGQLEYLPQKLQPLGDTIKKIFDDAKKSGEDFGKTVVRSTEELISIWQTKGPAVVTEVDAVSRSIDAMTDRWVAAGQAAADTAAKMEIWAAHEMQYQVAMVAAAEAAERAKTKATEDAEKAKDKARQEEAEKEKARQKEIRGFAISVSKQAFMSIGQDLAAGGSAWKAFGEAALHVIGRIIEAIGDQLAASAAADVVNGLAAAASIFLAWMAPGYLASAAVKAAGAAAAWVTAGALESIKLEKGGSFDVPGGFPNDSFPVRVSSGEHVEVTPAGQGEAMPKELIVNIDGQKLFTILFQASRDRRLLIDGGSIV